MLGRYEVFYDSELNVRMNFVFLLTPLGLLNLRSAFQVPHALLAAAHGMHRVVFANITRRRQGRPEIGPWVPSQRISYGPSTLLAARSTI